MTTKRDRKIDTLLKGAIILAVTFLAVMIWLTQCQPPPPPPPPITTTAPPTFTPTNTATEVPTFTPTATATNTPSPTITGTTTATATFTQIPPPPVVTPDRWCYHYGFKMWIYNCYRWLDPNANWRGYR